MTPTTRMPATLAIDIGGANTKAAWFDGVSLRTVSRPFEIWRDREALAAVLREVAAEAGQAEAVAITMTAELSDAFRTKREGVAFVLDAAQDALGYVSVLTVTGELVPLAAARARPLEVAAANWMATALVLAGSYPDALLIDVGSTTADVIPIVAGRVAARGRNDLERLQAGELVYTGVLRTNLAAIAPRVPLRGGWCPVASESFAISADVHLVLGRLAPEAYDCPTPDGRPATVEFARERIARLLCADVEQLAEREIDAIAAYLHDEQVRQIEAAARRVERQVPPAAPVVVVGFRRAAGARGRRPPRTSGGRCAGPGTGSGARAATGGAPVLTVVKVGGGLDRIEALTRVCATLAELGSRHRLLVVPGGAWFADAVRVADRRFGLEDATAHRMAILGMEQFGLLLRDLLPGGPPVVMPAGLALDELPESWDVTSDSIAAWVAGDVGADRLVLVKALGRAAELAGLRRRVPPDAARAGDVRDVADRARPARRIVRVRHDGWYANRPRALATVKIWVNSRCYGRAPWAATSSFPSARSGPPSSPRSSPACSGTRRRSTSRPTSTPGPSCPTSGASASPSCSPASASPRRPSPRS